MRVMVGIRIRLTLVFFTVRFMIWVTVSVMFLDRVTINFMYSFWVGVRFLCSFRFRSIL